MLRAGLTPKPNPFAQGLVHEQPDLAPVPGLHNTFFLVSSGTFLACNFYLLPIFPLLFTSEKSLALSSLQLPFRQRKMQSDPPFDLYSPC